MNAPVDQLTVGIHVHCDLCGAQPEEPCATVPSGKPAVRTHNDRRANAEVIDRHMRYLEAQKNT